MKKTIIFFTVFSLIFLFVLQCIPPAQESGDTNPSGSEISEYSEYTEETNFNKTVDSVGYVGMYTSIAVNSSNVSISYYDYSYGKLKFAKSTDGWNSW